jgi:hypothetical protein
VVIQSEFLRQPRDFSSFHKDNLSVSKWTRTRRDPGRTYQAEEEAKRLREDVNRVRELVREAAEGNQEAEPDYVRIINRLHPNLNKEDRKDLIKQFRDAVADQRRLRGLLSH